MKTILQQIAQINDDWKVIGDDYAKIKVKVIDLRNFIWNTIDLYVDTKTADIDSLYNAFKGISEHITKEKIQKEFDLNHTGYGDFDYDEFKDDVFVLVWACYVSIQIPIELRVD